MGDANAIISKIAYKLCLKAIMVPMTSGLFVAQIVNSGPDMILLLLKALISISAPFSPTRLTS